MKRRLNQRGMQLTLDQFLKLNGWVSTGGHAKIVIQSGEVQVNGIIEARRGRKLIPGDVVRYERQTATVEADATPVEDDLPK